MKTFRNDDEPTYFAAIGTNGQAILVKDEAIAKQLFSIANELKNISADLNDTSLIMDDEWRQLHEDRMSVLVSKRAQIINTIN